MGRGTLAESRYTRLVNRSSSDIGFLPAMTVGTLVVFYLAWAAMHDIAHAESDVSFEYMVLIACVPALTFLCRLGLQLLSRKEKVIWLGGLGVLVSLFSTAAVSAIVRPKYTADPMLGVMFLAGGLPLLGFTIFHLTREVRRMAAMRRTQ